MLCDAAAPGAINSTFRSPTQVWVMLVVKRTSVIGAVIPDTVNVTLRLVAAKSPQTGPPTGGSGIAPVVPASAGKTAAGAAAVLVETAVLAPAEVNCATAIKPIAVKHRTARDRITFRVDTLYLVQNI